MFPGTVVGTFSNQNEQEVLVDLGQEISINCPQHSASYGVSYSWQGKINTVDIQFKRNDRRAISQTGQLLIMYVTQQDIDDFAEYDSQGIRCFMTGANRFEYSGILKLKKKTAGKFFVFFFFLSQKEMSVIERGTSIPLNTCIYITCNILGVSF